MCRKAEDLTGKKYERLTVVERRGSDKHGKALWLCKCECGNEVVVRGGSLRSGHTTSCGCLHHDILVERNTSKEQCQAVKNAWAKDDGTRRQQITQLGLDNKGESNPMWKGGITPISMHLRGLNEQWFNDCKQQANYTCELTGKVGSKLNTHHLKAFNTIVLEAHELHNIEIHEIIGEYTQEELHKLEEYVESWHKDTSNAVVLSEEVHTLFHSLYGSGDNTPEQFEEFKERFLKGEFDDLLGDDLND